MAGIRDASQRSPGITTALSGNSSVTGDNIELRLPDGSALVAPFSLTLEQGKSVLVTGASGSGKSTLFRAIASLWPYGRGVIHLPQGKRLLFLPQKPYLIIGTLRAQLSYPAAADTYTDAQLKRALVDCDLPQLVERLDEEQHWAQQLSGGEQQRIAFARALLQKPDWLFMDEATASMDEAAEARLYALLRTQLAHTTVVSIGHRSTLTRFHDRRIELQRENGRGKMVFV